MKKIKSNDAAQAHAARPTNIFVNQFAKRHRHQKLGRQLDYMAWLSVS
jgi:hypothetical protein